MWKRVSHRARATGVTACGAMLAAALMLGACETAPETQAEPSPPMAAAPGAAAEAVVPAAPSGADAPPSGATAAVPPAPAGAELAARTEPPAPVIDSDPRRLIEMDSAALTDLLGRPDFIRDDAPAQLWRYRHESCVLDVFLYDARDPARQRFAVRHVVARGVDQSAMPADQCLREILLARMQALSG